jgi:DNA-binding transcriptional LysR family regulator
MPAPLDPVEFPYLLVGRDSLIAVCHPGLRVEEGEALPLLDYSAASFLGRMAALAQAGADIPVSRAAHVNENAMADALRLMAVEGHGLAWVPRSLAQADLVEGRLVTIGKEMPLDIRLYRKGAHKRAWSRFLGCCRGCHALCKFRITQTKPTLDPSADRADLRPRHRRSRCWVFWVVWGRWPLWIS